MDFSKEELRKITAYSLRVMARQMGVRSPSLKTKQELIDDILRVADGSAEIKGRTNRGRPCLKSLDAKNIVDFSPINITEEYVKNYTLKVNELFDEFIIKLEKVKEKYIQEILEISKDTKKPTENR